MLYASLLHAARVSPDAVAILETDGTTVTFAELHALARRVAARLASDGIEPGDRVAVHLPKSVDAVGAICGTLLAGGAYVPIDPAGPPQRAALAAADCSARHVFTTAAHAAELGGELRSLGLDASVHVLAATGRGSGIGAWAGDADRPSAEVSADPEATACILYTSGSTGQPKGVVLPHRAVTAFVDWAVRCFEPQPADRFASHAPFHFDLSLFDLFVAQRTGAAIVLIDEATSRNPRRLADVIDSAGVTVSYSTPTALQMLLDHGRLDRHPCPALRLVLFAGEVFPVPRLRRVMDAWPSARFFNLYGPTETNVCTWYGVPADLPDDPALTLPIGRACSHARVRIWRDGRPAAVLEEGELLVGGDGVMAGYWNRPEASAAAFLTDSDGTRWYRTGDIASDPGDGCLRFHGRRDRMVKRRGYRIELGEIESALSAHPRLGPVAVAAHRAAASGVTIRAFVTSPDSRPSVIDLKRFCAARLPLYMLPDEFIVLDAMPLTSSGKIDYPALTAEGRR